MVMLICDENIQVWAKVVISYIPAPKLMPFQTCTFLPQSQHWYFYRYHSYITKF